MPSDQEALIEAMFANAFGAPFLYKPKPYYKGEKVKVEKEPFDLAWIAGDIAVLFYLNRSTRPLSEQIDHNQRGAHAYVRLWASGDPRFVLPGKNRFDSECAIPFAEIEYLVTVLVVSAQCGIHTRKVNQFGKRGLQLVVPESFAAAVAQSQGTIVDFFGAIEAFFRLPVDRQLTSDLERHAHLTSTTKIYFQAMFENAADEIDRLAQAHPPNGLPPLLNSLPSQRIQLSLFKTISEFRAAPDFAAKYVPRPDDHGTIAKHFGDLHVSNHGFIAGAITLMLHLSAAPDFRYSQHIEFGWTDRRFVIASVSMSSSNFDERQDMILKAVTGDDGNPPAVAIVYARELFDPISWAPWMVLCPPISGKSFTKTVIDRLTQLNQSPID